jgi:molybdopterin biosynthesis enzyme MoaB
VRDVTPEALSDIGDRMAPGFGEAMRARSMHYTLRGCLGRGVAVTRGKTLIIAFPGSERAVRQCFEAIAPALRHGVEILIGCDADCGGH